MGDTGNDVCSTGMRLWEEQAMEKKKYFIVSADALPEVFVKVAEAKRMLQVGEAASVGQAAARVGISRSAF